MLICHLGNQNNIILFIEVSSVSICLILFQNVIYVFYSGQEDLTRVASCLWKDIGKCHFG